MSACDVDLVPTRGLYALWAATSSGNEGLYVTPAGEWVVAQRVPGRRTVLRRVDTLEGAVEIVRWALEAGVDEDCIDSWFQRLPVRPRRRRA